MDGYAQGALRKELHADPFVEHFKTATLGKLDILHFLLTFC